MPEILVPGVAKEVPMGIKTISVPSPDQSPPRTQHENKRE
jgi:hypothetical protein